MTVKNEIHSQLSIILSQNEWMQEWKPECLNKPNSASSQELHDRPHGSLRMARTHGHLRHSALARHNPLHPLLGLTPFRPQGNASPHLLSHDLKTKGNYMRICGWLCPCKCKFDKVWRKNSCYLNVWWFDPFECLDKWHVGRHLYPGFRPHECQGQTATSVMVCRQKRSIFILLFFSIYLFVRLFIHCGKVHITESLPI